LLLIVRKKFQAWHRVSFLAHLATPTRDGGYQRKVYFILFILPGEFNSMIPKPLLIYS